MACENYTKFKFQHPCISLLERGQAQFRMRWGAFMLRWLSCLSQRPYGPQASSIPIWPFSGQVRWPLPVSVVLVLGWKLAHQLTALSQPKGREKEAAKNTKSSFKDVIQKVTHYFPSHPMEQSFVTWPRRGESKGGTFPLQRRAHLTLEGRGISYGNKG